MQNGGKLPEILGENVAKKWGFLKCPHVAPGLQRRISGLLVRQFSSGNLSLDQSHPGGDMAPVTGLGRALQADNGSSAGRPAD